jgi:hypothetical protein
MPAAEHALRTRRFIGPMVTAPPRGYRLAAAATPGSFGATPGPPSPPIYARPRVPGALPTAA